MHLKEFKIIVILLVLIGCSKFASKPSERKPSQVTFENVVDTYKATKSVINIKDTNFYKELLRSNQIFSNPRLSNEVKSAQLDDLFNQLEHSCINKCDLVIKTIQKANTDIGAKSLKHIFKKMETEFPLINNLNNEFLEANYSIPKLKINENTLREFASKLEKVFKGKDKSFLVHKISASVQLLRYVIALEEDLLFDLSSNPTKSGLKQNQKYILKSLNKYKKQFSALYSLYKVIKPDNGKVVSDFSHIPIETIRKVAQNINDLGLFYIKIIQSVSNNKMIFNEEQQKVLSVFQDDLAPMNSIDVLDTIEKEFGKPANEMFIDFNPDDYIATGSIAQVYKTKIKTTFGIKEVIVKVQRKGLQEVINDNKKMNHLLMGIGKVAAPANFAPIMDLITGVLMGVETAFEKELDFTEEAKNMKRFKNYFKFSSKINIPLVYSKYSGHKVLTMQVMKGENIDKAWKVMEEKLKLHNSKKIFNNLLDSFLYQAFVTKEIHGDMHPGNIMLDHKKIGLIDFGQVFKSKGLITAPIRLAWNLTAGNIEGVKKALLELGTIGGEFGSDQSKVDDFSRVVERIMKEGRYEKVRYFKSIFKGEFSMEMEKWSKNLSLDHKKHVLDLITGILTKGHFHPNPMYVQFFRSALPVISTLYSIGKTIPKSELKKIAIRRFIMLYPTGYLKFFSSYTLRMHKKLPGLYKSIKTNIQMNCSNILNRISARTNGI